eukprot:12268920-Alexandrium_andersonii.AAC.1
MPMPVKTGLLTRRPLGRANWACLPTMKERVRSISQGGKRRHSRTARTHSGDSRSKALLWSIKRTALPPGLEGKG